jgi:hypothetical protein
MPETKEVTKATTLTGIPRLLNMDERLSVLGRSKSSLLLSILRAIRSGYALDSIIADFEQLFRDFQSLRECTNETFKGNVSDAADAYGCFEAMSEGEYREFFANRRVCDVADNYFGTNIARSSMQKAVTKARLQ